MISVDILDDSPCFDARDGVFHFDPFGRQGAVFPLLLFGLMRSSGFFIRPFDARMRVWHAVKPQIRLDVPMGRNIGRIGKRFVVHFAANGGANPKQLPGISCV
jgi:hypothetical protein